MSRALAGRAVSKKLYMSVDGGGSSLRAVLFDGDFQVLGQGRSGGVNLNSTTEADARANVRNCLEQVFTGAAGLQAADRRAADPGATGQDVAGKSAAGAGMAGHAPLIIDKLYVVFVGNVRFLFDELPRYAEAREIRSMPESEAGLMAGAMWRSGILAIAGTGSNLSLVGGARAPVPRREGRARPTVGAWGPILGDDGSGAWIGQKAVRAAITGAEGWSAPTKILDIIRRDWRLKADWDMVELVYRSPAPFRMLASLTRAVGEAAREGDAVALRILEEAGECLAAQVKCLINRFVIPAEDFRLVCCGGVWKTHPLIYGTFRRLLLADFPDLAVKKPRFEQIMAGPASEMLARIGAGGPVGAGKPEGADGPEDADKQDSAPPEDILNEAMDRLAECFPDYVITW